MSIVELDSEAGSRSDAASVAKLKAKLGAKALVVDGYHFSSDYQEAIKKSGMILLVIDDYGHAGRYIADLVLNQNVSATHDFYADRDRQTQLLLGTRYALLRREFRSWRSWTRFVSERANRILVTLGGSDPENLTVSVLEALEVVRGVGLEIKVAVGSSNPHYQELQVVAARSRFPVDLERVEVDMPQLMAWADLAVTAGGSTLWELAFMGLPSVVIISAENQKANVQGLQELGATVNLGWHGSLTQGDIAGVISDLVEDAGQRDKLSGAAKKLVDGMGADRASLALMELILTLRRVRRDDVRLLWEWANDPVTRAASFSSEPIAYAEHAQWFESKLKSENCLFFLVSLNDGLPLGQVRYDRDGDEAVISISLAESFRGQGYGSAVLRLACRKVIATEGINLIHAYIKQNNESSRRAFIKAGFEETGLEVVAGQEAIHLVARKDNTFWSLS
jgi:UDP-2,4-diacetamido-2,4,6-trideoxy-beta-L-altropyranose hydrolase